MRLAALIVLVAACSGEGYTPPTDQTNNGNDVDGDGFSSGDGDCNDDDASIYPGANDVVGDAIDQNCDAVDGVDNDRDGQAWTGSGGADCDDEDASIYDGAEEVGWDGIDQDCDGDDQYDFDKICAGKFHTCGLDTTGTIRCWGGDANGQVSFRPIDAGWVDLDCGYEFNCAVKDTGELKCWGLDEPGINQVSTAPTGGGWDRVFVGHEHACVMDQEGAATCWGADGAGQVSETPSAPFKAMALGREHTCALTAGGGVVDCWGSDGNDQQLSMPVAPFETDFVNIFSGADHLCAIRQDLGMRCWGRNNYYQADPPSDAGPYSWADSLWDTTCGVLESEDLSCWGLNNQYQVSDAPTGESIRYVGIGVDHGCAIKNFDGEVLCWGKNDQGQTSVPWP